jgi:hypothetical protein
MRSLGFHRNTNWRRTTIASSTQHQRRKAAKAARRKAIVAEKKRLGSTVTGLAERVRFAAKFPIASCLMPSQLFETGIGNIVIARRLPSGLLACGLFLVDTFCLGVKDAVFLEMEEDQLTDHLGAHGDAFVDLAPSCARKLVRDAVAYAADLGLSAARTYGTVEPIFGDVDADTCADAFTFGKDGKPLFIQGPHDTPARIRAIALSLRNRLGVDAAELLTETQPEAEAGEEEAPDGR